MKNFLHIYLRGCYNWFIFNCTFLIILFTQIRQPDFLSKCQVRSTEDITLPGPSEAVLFTFCREPGVYLLTTCKKIKVCRVKAAPETSLKKILKCFFIYIYYGGRLVVNVMVPYRSLVDHVYKLRLSTHKQNYSVSVNITLISKYLLRNFYNSLLKFLFFTYLKSFHETDSCRQSEP